MSLKKYSELIFGLVILALGIFYLIITVLIPEKNTVNAAVVDASFVPYILAFITVLLGILQLAAGIKYVKDFEEKEESKKPDYGTVLKTMGLIILYILFLNMLGFLISSIIFLVLEFIVLTPANEKKNYLLYVIIAVITSAVVYFTFRNALNLMLPEGLLKLGGI